MEKNSNEKKSKIKKNECYLYLKYKVDEGLEKISDLGLLGLEDFRKTVLSSNFTKEEAEKALFKAVAEGIVDLYYEQICKKCSFRNLFKEGDVRKRKKANKLKREGYECKNCSSAQESELPLDRKYCIGKEVLTEEESEVKTLFDKIKGIFP